MKRPSPLLSLLLAALFGSACASTPPPVEPAAASVPPAASGPAFLWEVKGKAGTVYVVGSIHLGRPGELPFPPSMEAAFQRSDALVVEVDVGKADAQLLQKVMLEQGMLPPDQRLSQRLAPETAKLLGPAAERVGLPLAALERMRPWAVAVMLSVLELQRAGYQGGLGVDRAFLDRARGTKDIVELESAEGQLKLLASLPEPLQDLMLRDQLQRSDELAPSLERLTRLWRDGDAEGMAAQLFEHASNPTYRPVYEKIFYERNARMAQAVAGMLEQPRTWFVVVGAGHVVGPEGMVALLQKQGHTVRQLPQAP